MALYKRISLIESEADLDDMTDELLDRYGNLPRSATNLLSVAIIRSLAARCGITQVRQDGADVAICGEALDVDAWLTLSNQFPGRLRMMMSATPYIRFRPTKQSRMLAELQQLMLELSLLCSEKKVDKT